MAPPEETGGPFRSSAFLRDANGNETLSIDENEWRVPSTNWDVEVVGRTITVRKRLGEIVLKIRSKPPGLLVIERLNMNHRGTEITCAEGKHLTVRTPWGQEIVAQKGTAEGCRATRPCSEPCPTEMMDLVLHPASQTLTVNWPWRNSPCGVFAR